MQLIKNIFLGLVFFSAPLGAIIYETDTLADLVDVSDQRCLVIVDLDNTLIRALTEEATDEWFRAEAEKFFKEGKTRREACDLVLKPYTEAQCRTKVRFVETTVPAVLDELYARKIQTIVLTSRGRPALVDATFRQFTDLGISFTQDDPAWQQAFTLAPLRGETLYKDGVIFCDGNNKGACLEYVFLVTGCRTNRIIMIDDARENLETVERFAETHGISFIGLHYVRVKNGLLDAPTKPFGESSTPSMKSETAAR